MSLSKFKIKKDEELILVDDNEEEHVIFRSYLKRSEIKDIRLKCFSTGEDFIYYMKESLESNTPMPGLILLDVRMPVLDGFAVLKEFYSNWKIETKPKIVMFSSSDFEKDKERAQNLGANDYQVKPQSYQEYIDFLNSMKGF